METRTQLKSVFFTTDIFAVQLADQLTLFKPKGVDYVPHTTTSPIGFKKLSTPLLYVHLLCLVTDC